MTEETRQKLSLVNLTEAPKRPYNVPVPKEGTVYDYRFVKEGMGRWEKWAETLKDFAPIPKDAAFNEIIVPTVDTVRYTALMEMLITHQKACLFVGPTGTGKSVYIIVSTENLPSCSGGHYLGSLSWYPHILVKSLQLIWISGSRRCHLRVPDLQMNCSDLIKWVCTRLVASVMATRAVCPSNFHK